jgi:glyoxylase-like metal-dependent hydrolase (beta-lactamase superfamily II)
VSKAASAGAEYEVYAVRYGSLSTRRSALFAEYAVYGEPDGPMVMDYFFWVLRDGDRTVLVDTGFDREVGRRRGRDVLSDPLDALDRLGIAASSVTHVVLTHLHYDHIGNVAMFPAARLVVSARELAFWTGPYGTRRVPAAPTERAEVDHIVQAHRAGRAVLAPDEDPGLPGLELLDLGGHTPGQLGVVVPTAQRRVVLASDAAHFYEEYERDMLFHVYSDVEGMYRGLDVLRMLDAQPGTVVVPGHDPDVMRRFPTASEKTEGLAVRLS